MDCYRNCKELPEVLNSSIQCLSKVVTQPEYLKVPTAFEGIPYKKQRLYIKYLDCKAQTTEGVFKNTMSRKYNPKDRQHYRRICQELIKQGWASSISKDTISLRRYQFVWRDLGIKRFNKWDGNQFKQPSRKASGQFFSYFKIPIDCLALDRKTYYKEILDIIHKRLADRRRNQTRWRLKQRGLESTEATFSGYSSALLFGYRSPATGSKLRKKHFSVISDNAKPYYNIVNHRWEEPTRKIAL